MTQQSHFTLQINKQIKQRQVSFSTFYSHSTIDCEDAAQRSVLLKLSNDLNVY